jgi:RHS repeat-associated protein
MQFYWDLGSQLDSVLVSGGGQASFRVDYRYDGYGRLIWRAATGSFPSTQRLYLYGAGSGGSNIGKEVDLVTGHTTEYEYAGIDHPTMSVTRDSTGTVLVSRTYMLDGLGNVVGSSLDGSSGAAIIYDSWGNVQTDSTAMMRLNTLRFGFKGMLYDETTGLYNARARWYQPDVGRFMSEDPIGLGGGMNQYAFAGDDPINNSDPSGALVTDAQGSVCSINASSCGDPLQFSGSLSGGAATLGFGDLSGHGGGGVTYAGGVSFSSVDWTTLGNWASQASSENVVAAVTADANYVGRPNWVAPALVERNSFMLNYTDQDGKLHYFNLEDAVFQRDGGGTKTSAGLRASYDVLSWAYDGSQQPGDNLLWARRIPVLSTLIRVGGGPRGFAGGFVQIGEAWGSFWTSLHP